MGAPDQDSEQEQAQSLARIEAGHIPLSAERRLSELRERDGAGASSSSFTSDLSINGFALGHRLGLTPLSQVMGSSIYQMGYQGAWGQPGAGGSLGFGSTFMVELDTLSEALNEVRTRALARLAEEARHVGADAVLEVRTRAGESALETGSVSLEHTVFGTAMRRAGDAAGSSRQRERTVLTELSVADFAKLVQAGFEPLGIVAWSSVFFAGYAFGPGLGGALAPGPGGGQMMGAMQNFELREFTQAFYNARETVMARLSEQAATFGASGIVGMRIGHTARRQSLTAGMGARERSGLMVTFNAIGTAIHQRDAHAPGQHPKPVIDLLA